MLESLNESKKLLPERVAEQIISLIADRALKTGDKLPNEFDMAQQLSVGRGTIREAVKILNDLGTPCIIHQPRYSMFERGVEEGLLDFLQTEGIGSIAFSPLAGGQLTDRYLNGIPADSRAASSSRFLQPEQLTPARLEKIRQLNRQAEARGQKLSQMALAWVLREEKVTSVLIGASKTAQLDDAVGMLQNRHFTTEECTAIDAILAL